MSASDGISNEIKLRITRAGPVYVWLGHLWCRRYMKLATKGWVYKALAWVVLLYAHETWSFGDEDIRCFFVFDCL